MPPADRGSEGLAPGEGRWAQVLRIRPRVLGLALGESVAADEALVAATDEAATQVTGILRVYRRESSGQWSSLSQDMPVIPVVDRERELPVIVAPEKC